MFFNLRNFTNVRQLIYHLGYNKLTIAETVLVEGRNK